MIGINTAEHGDPVAKARGFQRTHRLTYPILVDAGGKMREAFEVTAYPTNVLIDREGKIRYIEAGFNRGAIDQILQELIKERSDP